MAERGGAASSSAAAPAAAAAAAKPGSNGLYIVFVGQLSYKATAADISQHLKLCGVEGKIGVRLRTDRETGRSLGTAFATLETATALSQALSAHRTTILGRPINVEPTFGGRAANPSRQLKISETRLRMNATADGHVEETLVEFKDDLKDLGLDRNVMRLLKARDPATVRRILEAFAEDPRRTAAKNASALLTSVIKEVEAECEVTQSKPSLQPAGLVKKRKRDDAGGGGGEEDGGGDAGDNKQWLEGEAPGGGKKSWRGLGGGRGGRGGRGGGGGGGSRGGPSRADHAAAKAAPFESKSHVLKCGAGGLSLASLKSARGGGRRRT